MRDFHKDHFKTIGGFYFYKILDEIIKIGNLDKRDIKVLDFGCGLGKLKQKLGNKVVGYDILQDLTEVNDWRKVKFDVVVANEVFYLLSEKELKDFLKDLYKINPDVELIVCISGRGWLNKTAAFLAGERDAHVGTKLLPKKQLEILKEKMDIMDKENVFFLCGIFLMKFK